MIRAARNFVPVFIDTLRDLDDTRRFGEMQGSYPVLRILDHHLRDLAPRLDGNPVAGEIPARAVLQQMQQGLQAWR